MTLQPSTLAAATMVQTVDGFVVAQLVEIVKPEALADKVGYDRARAAVSKSIADDMTNVLVDAIRQRSNPKINQQGFDNVVQAQ